MKKVFLLCVLLCMNSIAFAESSISESQARYRLFPTKNMWTFLKLDTMTGKIWQVQYSIEGADYRFETVLNPHAIIKLLDQKKIIGRYTLYPTQNTYNFILLDQIDGHTYQVQWSGEKENRLVVPISD
ncbi:hypothetical protein [uncultured Fibrobacter sp.]|uniref:hypothetical protein n=1 Tax=uncultured Fibrobacter sp. TaxID=261512 RepID=UPI0025FFA520|nr:hypothetical protein [uncultured Fibrobacter sp.]